MDRLDHKEATRIAEHLEKGEDWGGQKSTGRRDGN